MANPLQRIRRGGQAPAAPTAAPEPALAEPGANGATGETEPATDVVDAVEPATNAPAEPQPSPAWRKRGRARRRLRYLHAARELALRDLGGLVFDLHRFGRERPDLVAAKLDALSELDRERRALQQALDDPAGLDVLRRPGLASCPRCGTLVGSDARFCSSCGVPLDTPAAPETQPEAEPEHVPGAAAATSELPGT